MTSVYSAGPGGMIVLGGLWRWTREEWQAEGKCLKELDYDVPWWIENVQLIVEVTESLMISLAHLRLALFP